MRYASFTTTDIPEMVWNRYMRCINIYGVCLIGKTDNLGWFIYQSEIDTDVLIWSEALS